MDTKPFRFLDDDEFGQLDRTGRVAYLVRAQQELIERQHVLRAQRKKVIGIAETIVPMPPAADEGRTSGEK